MREDIQQFLGEGIAAAKAGHKAQAKQLLLQVAELDETNVLAWLWLSGVVESRAEQEICLENVLELEPNHQVAQQALARLRQQPAQPPPVSPPEPVPPAEPASPPRQRSTTARYQRLAPVSQQQAATAPAKTKPTACPFCQMYVSSMATTCPQCRLPLVVPCPTCGAEVEVEQKSCLECSRAIGTYRHPVEFFAALGAAYQENQQYEPALKAWQAVETLEPDFADLHLHLGQTQVGLGRTDRATRSFEQALKQNPRSPQVHYALGELLRHRGEIEQAYPYYLKATELDPKYGLAWLRLGQLYEQAHRSKDAMQAYQRANKLLGSDSTESRHARQQLGSLQLSLPGVTTTGWAEFSRQMSGPVLVCLLAVLLDSGLRPWWIGWSGWLALFVAIFGTFLWVSADTLPRNPVICQLVGQNGLTSMPLRRPIATFGLVCWFFAFALIMLPIDQLWPQPPNL
jgi:tetratricopeptide (TPR) repeat protein